LTKLRADHRIDSQRLYAMGHSNGGRFTYVLWAARGELFAAFGPSGSPATGLIRQFEPKPVFAIAGEKDALVPYESQRLTIDALKLLLRVQETPRRFGDSPGSKFFNSFSGKDGLELCTYVHPGGHEYPQDAVPLLVTFFGRHALR
jgi:polyhydroxybutyrate depolymerase